MIQNYTTLLMIDKILHIFLHDNILTIKLLGDCFTDEIIQKLFNVIEIFYDICKKKNKKFYTIYDLIDCKLINLPNYIYYINDIVKFLKKHNEFYKIYLHSTLFITETEIAKNLCNLVLSQYSPARPFKFITKNEPISFDFE